MSSQGMVPVLTCASEVFGMADPGDAVRVHPHAGALNGMQVRVGDIRLLTHAMQVGAGAVDRLPCVVVQGVFE